MRNAYRVVNPLRTIPIPWEQVRAEFEWIGLTQGEAFSRTFILRHPEVLETGLELVGIELALPDGEERLPNGTPMNLELADVVFLKRSGTRSHYFVVETEESIKNRKGPPEAQHRAELLDAALKKRGAKDYEITPVFIGIEGNGYGSLVGVPLT